MDNFIPDPPNREGKKAAECHGGISEGQNSVSGRAPWQFLDQIYHKSRAFSLLTVLVFFKKTFPGVVEKLSEKLPLIHLWVEMEKVC